MPDFPSDVLLRRATFDDVGKILACLHAALDPYKPITQPKHLKTLAT
jgi:hypothetical protein